VTTKTLPNSTTTTYTYNGSSVTLVNTGIQGAPGANGLNFGFVVAGNNDTLVNNGTVFGQRVGVYVTGSGDSVINAAAKNITATEPDQAGVNFYNFSGTITNYGIISGYANSVNGGPAGNSVELEHGGVVTNFGTLLNGGVLVGGAAGTVTNSGVILGNAAYGGVYMRFGGQVTNLAGGLISANGATASYEGAPPYGVFIHGGAGTVTNAGTINGNTGNAVDLAVGFQNRLIVDPGAAFVGTANGGTAIDATLELASSASTGTLSGFGTQIINFGTLAFDPSASWLVAGNTALASTVINGFTTSDTIDLTGFVAVSETFATNTETLTNGANAHVTLHIQGAFGSSTMHFGSDGSGGTDVSVAAAAAALLYGQTIDETGIVATSETVTAGVMTLRNSGGTAVGTIAVGTSLSSSAFILASDGSGGTDVIVDTVFGTYSSGVTLLVNPTTIATTGTITGTVASGIGVDGPNGTAWTLTNLGLVSETGADSDGVSFASAGTIVNAASGTIAGFGHGVVLNAGGSLTNQAGGTISGYDGITAQNASATVVNGGIVTGDPAANSNDSAVGIGLDAGGSVTNQSSGTISAFHYGIGISGAPGTVLNLGHINSGSVYNAIAGVYLLDGGEATNGQSGGTVSSAYIASYRYAIRVGSANAGTITNFGTLNGESGVGARVVNGVIVNGPSGATGALIEGGAKAVLVDGTGTVVNYGTIRGSESGNYYGVKLDGAGTVANLGTASLIDAYIGVYGQSDDTVTNAGTILSGFGAAGVAVEFHGGTNRLIVDPGAVFTGSLSAAGITTLELASAASAGTLTGIAITNFTSLVFDTGAQWTVAGSASASGFGTLGITGFTFGDTIDLTGFAAVSRTFASDALLLTDSADAHVTLAIQSGLTTANFQISSDGNGGTYIDPQIIRNYGDTIDETGIVAASEAVIAGVMTLRDGGNAIVGTIPVGPSLNSGAFILRSDGSGGTDVVVSTVFGTYTTGVTLLTNPTTIASTANISAASGNALFGAGGSPGWTINNYGVINGGTNAYGIQLGTGGANAAPGIITNAAGGSITGRYGIRLYNSSTFSIVNLAGGTIVATGTNADRAIDLEGAAGTVTNAGLIIAQTTRPFDVGVELDGGGTVINTATGTIAGGFGVFVSGAGTVVNAGTISGVYSNEFAVALGNGDRLVVDPGAVFAGAVNGGFGGGSSTLELASAASAGTLTATNFTNFSTIDFDAGAAWTLAGATTALSGTIAGFTFGDTIDLTGFAAASSTFASDTLVLTDGGSAHDTLHIQGSFVAGNFHLSSDGNGGTDIAFGAPPLLYAQTIDEVGIVATSETVTAGVMTLTSGASTVGTIAVGPTLSTGDFILQPDGSGGTDVIVSSIFGTYTSGVTLVINPTSIVGTASITGGVTSAIGVTGLSGTAWTLTNQGLVSETGAGSEGISFASNGSIINAGVVSGAAIGIRLNAGGLVSNQSGGTIGGVQGIYVRVGATTIVNSGSISGNVTSGSGIAINAGGSVTNLAGGTISGSYGINVSSVAATVVNSGSIGDGSLLPTGAAIALKHGGKITNLAGGQIIAGLQGIYIGGVAGTIVNAGSVGGGPTTGNGIIFATVGVVTNQSGGVITGKYGIRAVSGAVTVTNAGSIGGNLAAGGGLNLAAGGSVTNQSGGTITGQKAVLVTSGTVTNAGSIGGNTAIATGAGVQLSSGGSFTNQSGGAVTGFAGVFSNGAATVVNAGNIGGNLVNGRGISLTGSGSVSNQAGGVITGFDGILAVGSATVVNAGSIGGATAVAFGAGVINRLVIDPGAVFSGTVDGGNTIGGAFISTMELAPGASAGTLSGLGTQFINFAASTIDAGANWTFSGANTLAAGATLVNSGTLTDIGTLLNSGSITGNKLSLNGGMLNNRTGGVLTATYVYGVRAGAADMVVNQGIITDTIGSAIYLAASGSVTNAVGGVIHGYGPAVKLSGTAAAVTNLGQIVGASASPSYGVYLRDGGLITNGQAGAGTSTASIRGYYGVTFKSADVVNAYGTLINFGTVIGSGTESSGVLLSNAGTVLNGQTDATTALIEGGRYGVSNGQGAVVNDATIIATGTASGSYGVGIQGVGRIDNLGTASLIEGHAGVLIGTDGTVTNAGTIASNLGSSGVAVDFTGGDARLIDDPGAVFVGSIDGGSGGTAVLELASASSAGVISGLGGAVTNFTSLVFDAGAQWTVSGNDAASGLGTLGISGFVSGDTIDLTGFVAVSRSFASDTLVLTDNVNAHETLHIQGGFATNNFHIASDGTGGTDVSFATPPTIVAGGIVTFIGGGSPVTLDGSLTVTDGISTPLTSGTVSLGTGFTAGDTLDFTAQNGISGSFSAATGTLTLTGFATIADYQAALDSITYSFSPGNGDPTSGGGDTSRTIDWVLSDGVAVSDIGSSSLTTVHVGPTITAGGTVTYATGGTAAVLDAAVAVSDPDSAGMLTGGTVAITAGTFGGDGDILSAITTDASISLSYNAGTEILTLSGRDTLADYQAVLRSVAFHSSAFDPTNDGANPDRTISWTIGDGVSIAATGTSILDVTRLLPVVSGTSGGQTTTDEAMVSPFTAVSVADPNGSQTEIVTISLSSAANGSLSNLGGGTFNSGTYAVTGTTLAVTDAIEGLVFTPTAHQIAPGGTIATVFTIAVTDTNGVSVSDSTTTVIATAVNDPPTLILLGANAGVPNQNGDTPFAGVTITDPDVGHIDTITITLSDAAGGTLSNLSGGSYNATTGVYIVTGAAEVVTAALQGLVFTPAPPASGLVRTTGFTVVVTGLGGTVSNSSLSVTSAQQVLSLAGTPTADDNVIVSPDGSSFATPTNGANNEAVVTEPTGGVTYVLPTGYQAEFLGGSADASLTDTAGGNALLVGNTGSDTISAAAANDTILGGSGNNLLSVSGTDDVVIASGMSTVMSSGSGDTVFGGSGNPTLVDNGISDMLGLGGGTAGVTLSGSGARVYANTGAATIVDAGTNDAIGGYTGNLTVTLSGSGSTVFGGSGPLSVDMISTASGVAIGAGSGTATITIAGGDATVYGGSGTLSVDATGSDALIGAGSNMTSATIGGANTTILGGTGSLNADVTASAVGTFIGLDTGPAALILGGRAAEVFGGAGSLNVEDMGSGDTVGAGAGSTRVTASGSGSVVEGGGGSLLVFEGVGSATVFGGTGSTTVTGAAGATTLFGSAGGIISFVGGGGGTTYQAGAGNETLDSSGSNTANIINGGLDAGGGDSLVGGAGNDSLFAGTGSDTFVGGGGSNEFVFYKTVVAGSAPHDLITDFSANDQMILAGYGAGAAANALATGNSAGGATTIVLSDNTMITFLDIASVSSLQGHVFSV
jgi:fibronectin-binding autotransporter adhesin